MGNTNLESKRGFAILQVHVQPLSSLQGKNDVLYSDSAVHGSGETPVSGSLDLDQVVKESGNMNNQNQEGLVEAYI